MDEYLVDTEKPVKKHAGGFNPYSDNGGTVVGIHFI